MVADAENKSPLESAGEDLFGYAIDREDVHWLLQRLPEEAKIDRVKVEYELPLLKIISVGWSLSYHLENRPQKEALMQNYWQAVQTFARELSDTTGLMIGQDIDYFEILRERLDAYVAALAARPDAPEPAAVIGPEFAANCGNGDDVFTIMTGSKMFISTSMRVRQYLEAINFI